MRLIEIHKSCFTCPFSLKRVGEMRGICRYRKEPEEAQDVVYPPGFVLKGDGVPGECPLRHFDRSAAMCAGCGETEDLRWTDIHGYHESYCDECMPDEVEASDLCGRSDGKT